MADITLLEDVDVELVQHVGGDSAVVNSARVSLNEDKIEDFQAGGSTSAMGLINYLMRKRHGTPFEHNSITFRVRAPIFVFREWHRHRIQSFSEMSGRYTNPLPEFYVPSPKRPLVNIGTSANPKMGPASPEVVDHVRMELDDAYEEAWAAYQKLLGLRIANEIARLVLPVGIMSQMYVTTNLRGWLHFLGLRTEDERAAFPSAPQREIAMAAEKIEVILHDLFPISLDAFNTNGRVAP